MQIVDGLQQSVNDRMQLHKSFENTTKNSSLTHSFYGTYANRIAPDGTTQNAASHLGIFCLLTGISSKNEIKMKNYT